MADVTMYGTPTCSDCRRSKDLLDSLGVGYDWIDISVDAASAEAAQQISGRMGTPVVVFPDGSFQVEPTDAELTDRLTALALL